MVVRRLEHLSGAASSPRISYAVETRDRPGPAHKSGAYPDDGVWIQLHGGLMIAKARIELCWIGEYSDVREVRARTKGSDLYEMRSFWTGRPRYGYAAVASLYRETWIDPYWAGPRTYGYEWVLLDDKKKASWLDQKPPPRSTTDLEATFKSWLSSRS